MTVETAAVVPRSTGRFGRFDLLACVLLAGLSLALRVGSLDRVALNPDESQYEAMASYLVATDRSAFSLPYLIPATLAIYKTSAALFGPYTMWPIRGLVLLLVTFVSLLLYDLVRRRTNRWTGLFAGVFFLGLNPAFEGLSANREWFSTPLLVAGLWCWEIGRARAPGTRRLLWQASGLLSVLAPSFKLQAAPIALAVPLAMLVAPTPPGVGRRRALTDWALGAGVGALAYLGAFLVAGGLSGFVGAVRTFLESYLVGNTSSATAGSGSGSLVSQLFVDLPYHPLVIAGYLVALFSLAAVVRRTRPDHFFGDPLLVALSLQCVAALGAIAAGGRFFAHYYLFLIPPLAALAALALRPVLSAGSADGSARTFTLTLGSLIGLDAAIRLGTQPIARWPDLWPRNAPTILYWALLIALLVAWSLAPLRRGRRALVGVLVLEGALLATGALLAETPRSLPFHRHGFDDLVQELRSRGGADERLFVWGWAPEIYSLTRMESASHVSISQYVVGDYTTEARTPRIEPRFAELLMRDLEERRPRFIVDAWRRSWTMVEPPDPRLYRLEMYPDFALRRLLDREYTLVGSFDECDLYERGVEPGFTP